ncbi:C-X-C motif chemokine 9 [Salmo salar]|uniref:C-X-C motif chemokine 9 n=1 Tax=Salmo salar TaxID=8030 RepID=A0A1S3N2Z8_SALSA|nr:C-X-C motif chemokine 9 [Salmo salar]|eukprot:XP_014009849.1 PREDICTED: C-X-C motif chemokine 9-like [Salmo salar]
MNSVLSVYLLASLPLYCLLLTVGKGEGQFVPGRCECYDTKTTVSGPLSDLKVTLKGITCNTDQIIVVMKRTSEPVCVNPMGPLGKQLLRCWKKTSGLDKKRCLRRRRGQGKRGQKQRKHRGQSKESKRRATPIPALG